MSSIGNFALIIGAMKSGTTSLFNYLREHPEIAPSKIKEPNYFVDDDKWSGGWSSYQRLWDWDPSVHRVALEASVSYTKIPSFANAAERISEISLKRRCQFKFIYIMRNPIERIESHYTHGQGANWTATRQPLTKEVHQHLIEVSSYAKQIDEYYKRFAAEQIMLLVLEEFRKHPEKYMKSICKFLEVDPNFGFNMLSIVHNSNVNRITNPLLVKLKYTPVGRKLSETLSPAVKEKIKNHLGRQQEQNIRLHPLQRAQILEFLRQDLRRLQMVYGVDVAQWGIET